MNILAGKFILFSVGATLVLGGGYILGQVIFQRGPFLTLGPACGAFVIAFMLFQTLFKK